MLAFTQVVSKNIVLRSKGVSRSSTCLLYHRKSLLLLRAITDLLPPASLVRATRYHNVAMCFWQAPLHAQVARPGRTIAAADYQPTAPRNHGSFPLTTCEQPYIATLG